MRWATVGVIVVAAWATNGSPASNGSSAGPLVFSARASYQQLYTVRDDGSGLRQITHALGGVWAPALSPDASLIAFETLADLRHPELAVGSVDGRSYRVVARPQYLLGWEWSPNSRWIAYVDVTLSASGEQTESLWLIRPDGSEAQRLASAPTDLQFAWSPDGRSLALTDGKRLFVYRVYNAVSQAIASFPELGIGQPTWSPDGSDIAYARVKTRDLLVYDGRTGATRVVASFPPTFLDDRVGPVNWSPNGREIAFVAAGFYSSAVHVVGSDGQGDHVVDRTGNVYSLVWSPDGSHLGLVWKGLGPGSLMNLDVVRADGTGLVPAASARMLQLVWSPSGRDLVYGGEGPLERVSADGTERRTILSQPAGLAPVAWSSDGTRLLLTGGDPASTPSSQLFSIDPGTQVVRVLTEDGGDHDQPVWDADGRTLAYVQVEGGAPRVVVDGVSHVVAGVGTEPALSPTGAKVAFVTGGRILVATVATQHSRLFARGTWPAWSPGGRKIVYLRKGAIWIANANGTGKRPVLRRPGSLGPWGRPSWLGGSQKIYVRRGNGPNGVIVSADGSTRRAVTFARPLDVLASDPTPDGTQITVEWRPPGFDTDQIASLPVDGSALHPLFEVPRAPEVTDLPPRLAWQPDSSPSSPR